MHFSNRLPQSTRINRLCSLRGCPRFSFGSRQQRSRGRKRCHGAECISPGAGDWGGIWTATGDLGTPRWRHTATLLPNDQVLVAGGGGNSGALASAQLYHPAIGRWQRIADMNHSHVDHTATLLPNGLVLVAGGAACNGATYTGGDVHSETYDATSETTS